MLYYRNDVRAYAGGRIRHVLMNANKTLPLMKRLYFKGGYIMKRKNIDTMREIRLWVGQIIVPAVTVVGSALAIPEVRQAISIKADQWKESVERKIKKGKNEVLK